MQHIRVLICQVDDGCPGWLAHPYLKAMDRAVDKTSWTQGLCVL